MKKYALVLLFVSVFMSLGFYNNQTTFAASTIINSTRSATVTEKASIATLIAPFFTVYGTTPLIVDAPDFDSAFSGSIVNVNTVGDVNPPEYYQEAFVNIVELPILDPCYTGDPIINFIATSNVTIVDPTAGVTPGIALIRTSDGTAYGFSNGITGAGVSNMNISTTIPKAVYDSGDFYLVTISTETGNNGGADYAWSDLSGSVTYDSSTCINNAPTATDASASATLPINNGQTLLTGSSLNASDVDGDTLSYAISSGNDLGYFIIDSSTGNITSNTTSIPTGTYSLTIEISDGNGGVKSVQATITITDTAKPPTLVNTGTKITLLSITGLGILIAIYLLKKRSNILSIMIGKRTL